MDSSIDYMNSQELKWCVLRIAQLKKELEEEIFSHSVVGKHLLPESIFKNKFQNRLAKDVRPEVYNNAARSIELKEASLNEEEDKLSRHYQFVALYKRDSLNNIHLPGLQLSQSNLFDY